MASSVRPSQIPTSGGSGAYIAGVVVLGGLAAALFAWKKCGSTPPQPVTQQSTSATAAATQPEPINFNPPPPPPKLDEVDAGDDGGGKVAAKGTATGPIGPGPCGGKCEGSAPGALQSAIRSTAQSAAGCYQRALRTSEVSGSMMVAVQVSANGSVCSASIARDDVHSSAVSSCVVERFRSKQFPPPTGGCVTVQVPISFSIKENK